MLRVHLLRRPNGLRRQSALQVRLEIEREFGLAAIALDHLFDRFDVGQRGVGDFRTNAPLEGLGADGRQPIGVGDRQRGNGGDRLLHLPGADERRQHDCARSHDCIDCTSGVVPCGATCLKPRSAR
jgi:hypothetical protein